MVPYGYKATIYDTPYFSGASEEIHGMNDVSGRPLCQNVQMSYAMESMEVEKLK